MNRPLTLTEIESALRAAWCADTAHSPSSWDADNPAAGQCWTSAYVIRALLGGEIVLAEIAGTLPQQRHAWNRLPGGIEVDVTRDQFDREPELVECDVPEEIVQRVSGAQAELLLRRVRASLEVAFEFEFDHRTDTFRNEALEPA